MKKYFPFAMALASTVGLIGCMNVNPSNLSKTLDSSLNADTTKSGLTNLSIRFKPEANYNTQAGGTYATEIRLMYTEAVVRNDATDYHFGLKGYAPTTALGTVAYTLNEGTPALWTAAATDSEGLPVCAYYPAVPGADDPLFSLVKVATGSSPLANVATKSSSFTGSYIYGAGIYKDMAPVTDPAAAPADILTSATGSVGSVVATFSDRLDANMLRSRPAVDSVDNVLKNIFKGTQVISYTTAAKTATSSVLIDPKSAATTGVTAPYIQAIAKDLTAPDGTSIAKGAVYFKMTLPALVKEVKFPALPLGRLVIDVRKFSGANIVSSYSYGQFMLLPAGNALAVGDISGSITTENNPGITF